MSPIGLAVIGVGYWGPNLVRTARATPEFRLEWLCDLDQERARRALDPYTSVRPTATVAEGEKLAGLARRSGLVLMCDHIYCYTPAVRRIRDLIHSGEIGDVQFVDSVRVNLGLFQPDVDVLWDLAPHDLSILDFVLPDDVRPVAVAAHTSDPVGTGRACLAYLSVWLSTGVLAHVNVNWLSPTKIRTTVIGGTRRTIVWDDLNPSARLMIHDRGVDLQPPRSLAPDERAQALIAYRTGDASVPALPEYEALMKVMAEFAGAITEGRRPLTDVWAGLRVLAVLAAASQSAEKDGMRVPVGMPAEMEGSG